MLMLAKPTAEAQAALGDEPVKDREPHGLLVERRNHPSRRRAWLRAGKRGVKRGHDARRGSNARWKRKVRIHDFGFQLEPISRPSAPGQAALSTAHRSSSKAGEVTECSRAFITGMVRQSPGQVTKVRLKPQTNPDGRGGPEPQPQSRRRGQRIENRRKVGSVRERGASVRR